MPFNHFILCCPLFLLPTIFPSISLANELAVLIRGPKYRYFSSSIIPSNEYSGLNSFRIDRFDFLAVQGAPKNLLQHHNSKSSLFWSSPFFVVPGSHPYMTTGNNSFTIQTSVSKMMDLIFNMLSRFVIAFLSKSKCFQISQLQSLITVILELKKRISATVSTFSPSICYEVMWLNALLVFWMLSFKPPFSLLPSSRNFMCN